MTGMCYTVPAKTNTDGAFCFSDASRSQLHITRYGQSAPYVLDLRPAVRLGNDRQAHRGRFVMDTREVEILNEVQKLRTRMKDLVGIELFECPIFIEQLVCTLGRLTRTSPEETFDGYGHDGLKVEIKHSNLTYSKGRSSKLHSRTFRWDALQGCTGAGKDADVYVLTGYDYEQDQIRFFVIPAWWVGRKKSIQLGLGDKRTGCKWYECEVFPGELTGAIQSAFEYHQRMASLFAPKQ
jgi:hypothetical protein